LCFREKKYATGREAYLKAIEKAAIEKNKHLENIAMLNYAREEILAKTDQIEFVMQLVSKISDNENDISIKKLHSEVLELYRKYKEIGSRKIQTHND
jgi:hypothetical protein